MVTPSRPRRRDALVVTWNLKEAFERPDLADKRDLRAAASRLATALPKRPDVVLLQEIIGNSAKELARLLSARTNRVYEVAAAPPGSTHIVRWAPPQQTIRDSAIVINSNTMAKIGRAAWIASTFRSEDADPAAVTRTTGEHPLALLQHRPTGARVAVASVHFTHGQGLIKQREDPYKAMWLREIGQRMDRRFGRDPLLKSMIIGGDLNANRCFGRPERVNGKEREFWKVMTTEMGYLDAVFAANCDSDASLQAQYRRGQRTATKRIDYIFVKGLVKVASHDLDYDPPQESEEWATDHRSVYALVDLRT